MGKDPLDFPTLKNNPAEYEVVVTSALTGKAEYFGKETMVQDDYRLIMASSTIPAACRPVELNNIPYFDGGLSDAIPVSRALEKRLRSSGGYFLQNERLRPQASGNAVPLHHALPPIPADHIPDRPSTYRLQSKFAGGLYAGT